MTLLSMMRFTSGFVGVATGWSNADVDVDADASIDVPPGDTGVERVDVDIGATAAAAGLASGMLTVGSWRGVPKGTAVILNEMPLA